MLSAIYLVLLTFKVAAAVGCLTLCFLIARMGLTPTSIYMSFACAFGLMLVAQLWVLFYIRPILIVWAGLSVQQMVIGQLYDAGILGFFLFGYVRKYRNFVRHGFGHRTP